MKPGGFSQNVLSIAWLLMYNIYINNDFGAFAARRTGMIS